MAIFTRVKSRFIECSKQRGTRELYLVILAALVLVQLVRLFGNSCRLFLFTLQEADSSFPPWQWWTAIDVRSVFWLLTAPLLALIVVRRDKTWLQSLGAHFALLTTGLLISGTLVQSVAHMQAVEREQIRGAIPANLASKSLDQSGGQTRIGGSRVQLLQPYSDPSRLIFYEPRYWVGQMAVGLTDYGLMAVLGYAVLYFRLHEQRSRQTEQLEHVLVQARHDALCARLTHHFLFNTLNTISSLTLTNGAAARNCIGHLGELLRASIDSLPKGEVRLDQELRNIEIYLELQQVRFGDKLVYSIDVEPGLEGAQVPAFLLQPLVENSFEHGFRDSDPLVRVWIVVRRHNDICRIDVLDNGVNLNGAVSLDERHGLGVTRERLFLQYNGSASLFYCPNQPSGLCVSIHIPFQTKQSSEGIS